MTYSYGRRSGRGRGRGGGRGSWPGNGPFAHLPPWERPGWVYGPGSCWALGYRTLTNAAVASVSNPETLRNQKEYLEAQLKSLQETLAQIENRLANLED